MISILSRIAGTTGKLRALARQIHNRYFGVDEKFSGNAQQICMQIIDRLWEGDFYKTSLGHFDFFWMRDFGTVSQSLVTLGHGARVRATLKWALEHYRRFGAVTLCIDKAGRVFNAPVKRSVDALPWLLHALVVSEYQLSLAERAFLEHQLETYAATFLDPATGELRNIRYAEMRDAVIYNTSAYAVTLVARMAKCARQLGLTTFPFSVTLYQNDLINNYWTGEFFRADRNLNSYSSDCALMPFFLEVIDDADKARRTIEYIEGSKLNKPYPLVYSLEPKVFHYRFGMGNLLMPNYTGTTVWTWHGTFYLHILKRYKQAKFEFERDQFSCMIEKLGTYPELLNRDGSWFKTPFYRADGGMIWAALLLDLDVSRSSSL